jgi:predicted amidohydrolase
MRKYKIGMIQMDTRGDRDDNLKRIEAFIAQAKAEGVALITLPEVMNRMTVDRTIDTSEPLDGPTITFMKECAKKYDMWIHCGSIREKQAEGLPYNTTVLLNPEGETAAIYRKIHLYDVDIPGKVTALESSRNKAGEDVVSVETPMGHLGLTICYDLRFPELFRLLSLQGSEIIFVPANFAYATGVAHWETLLRARAIENGCYIIASAQTGEKREDIRSYGHSLMIDPWGEIIAEIEKDEAMAIATVDLDMVKRMREELPSLKNRRPDVYRLETVK